MEEHLDVTPQDGDVACTTDGCSSNHSDSTGHVSPATEWGLPASTKMLLSTDNRGGPQDKLTTLEPSAQEDGVLAAICSSVLTNTGLHENDSTECMCLVK